MSFLRRLFSFLLSKETKDIAAKQPCLSPQEEGGGKPTQLTVEGDGNPKSHKYVEIQKPNTKISTDVKNPGEGSDKSFTNIDSETNLTEKPKSSPNGSTVGLGDTLSQSGQKQEVPVETSNTLIDWNDSEKVSNVKDSNVSKLIPSETPHTASPTTTYKPPIESIKPSRVISHYTMKICPKTGEHMKEIEVLGEKIDVSSAGCYFDRGELARILGSKPSFLQSVGNFLTGKGNPYETADRGAEVIMLQQEIQKSEARLRSLRLGSPEYDLEYTNLKSLNAKMQGMNR